MITPFSTITAQIIQTLEGCSSSTSYRRLQEVKEHFNITVVRVKHLADFWLASSEDIIAQLLSK
jgi:hypothetical protein